MDKIILIIVLAVIALVLIFAIKNKSFFGFIKNLNKDKIKDKIPKINFNEKEARSVPEGTIIPPDLYMHQLTESGNSFYKHSIRKGEMSDKDGTLVGLPVSHPGADHTDGLKLHGTKTKYGTYDKNDSSTYRALTVNTKAITIAYDDKGFFAQVTNPQAKVFFRDPDSEDIFPVKYDDTFDIVKGTFALIGSQWLYFDIPDIPSFPGSFSVNTEDINPEKAPEFTPEKTTIRRRPASRKEFCRFPLEE